MGVHTRATEILREHGYQPELADKTYVKNATALGPAAKAAVNVLAEQFSTEGLVRIYALLESASKSTAMGVTPAYAIGEGPAQFRDALKVEIDKRKPKVDTGELEALRGQIDSIEDQLAGLAMQIDDAIDNAEGLS